MFAGLSDLMVGAELVHSLFPFSFYWHLELTVSGNSPFKVKCSVFAGLSDLMVGAEQVHLLFPFPFYGHLL